MTIITKNSSTASAVPLAGDLVKGELAINVTDKKLYTKDNSALVIKIVGSLGNQEANAVAVTGGTVAGVAQTGGTLNNTPVGATTASTVTGTVVTASTGFVGPLTGAVTGNTAGVHTGAVTGAVTGNLAGNVVSAGTSTFNNVTISGSLDMDSGTAATVTGLAAPVNASDAATKSYVDTTVSALVASAPAALDTLNELAAALGNDASFATNVNASIAAKLPLAGGTMSGALAMGSNKITGMGAPTVGTDASTKTYTDAADALKLALAGGTMSGAIEMGTNKVTGLGTPSASTDATTKGYVDSILGSATSAATSASNAATSETNAGNSATAASGSASAASTSASDAAASYDAFDDRYLGAKSSVPTLDNDGNALITGALYFDTSANEMRVWTSTLWKATGSAVNGTSVREIYTATAAQTTFAVVYDAGYVDVYLNGVKQVQGVDFTASSGTNIVFASGLVAGDSVDIVAYGAFALADVYTKVAADARYLKLTGGTLTGALTFVGGQTFPGTGDVTLAGTQTLTNKTLTGYKETVFALGTSGSQALNPANGTVQTCAASAAVTFTDSLASGQSIVLMLTNGATYTVAYPTITWVGPLGNVAPTLNAANTLVFWKVVSTLYGAVVGKYA
jgi:hypothetical protein